MTHQVPTEVEEAMSRAAHTVPFDGQLPDVGPGDAIEIRDVVGRWHPATAGSVPRYDKDNALGGRCYLTVAVRWPGRAREVNWPAEAVRRRTADVTGGYGCQDPRAETSADRDEAPQGGAP